MLRDAQSLRPILRPRHPTTWHLIISGPHKLTPIEFNYVIAGITRDMIGTHDKVTVPGFKAGRIWQGKPWFVLWDKTADERLAAWMLGLMAQYAFIHHPTHCYTDKTTYAGHDYPNAYYFQQSPAGMMR
jgi:hypothetical protein